VGLRNEQVIDDEVLRRLEKELDLAEMRLELTSGDLAEWTTGRQPPPSACASRR
jgi:hypothetical protein